MKKYAVIVAGGSGTRMGGAIPKQFRTLSGRPVLWWSIKAFYEEDSDTRIIVVIPENFMELWEDFYSSLPHSDRIEHQIVAGGTSRTESVRNGLSLIDDTQSLVAVHDGARPLVSAQIIQTGWVTAIQHGAAVPVIPVTDSLRHIEGNNSRSVNRSEYVAVQTPQVFKTGLLKDAYSSATGISFTDDAAVVEHFDRKVALFDGSPDNIKVTHPADLITAEFLMKKNA